LLRIIAAVVIVALVRKFDHWASTEMPDVPRWVFVVAAIASFISLLLLGLGIEKVCRSVARRLSPVWQRFRARFDRWESQFEKFLGRLDDRWLLGGAAAAVILSALAATLGVVFNMLPNDGFVSPQSLLFLGFLLASTCIGLCKRVKARVWAVILSVAGFGMWCFSASIG
jgi:predicted PurR-regulated permease PerM